MLAKIIIFVKKHKEDIILIIGVILISLFSFASGYVYKNMTEKEEIRIEDINE